VGDTLALMTMCLQEVSQPARDTVVEQEFH
jgi:hypothetical protein